MRPGRLRSYDEPHACRQRPLVLLVFDQVQHGLQMSGGLRLRDGVYRRLLALPVV